MQPQCRYEVNHFIVPNSFRGREGTGGTIVPEDDGIFVDDVFPFTPSSAIPEGIDPKDVGTLKGLFSGEDLCSTVPLA